MVTCRTVRDTLASQALNETGVADLDEVREHLAACPACQGYLKRFSQAIRSDDPDEIPCVEARARLDAHSSGGATNDMAALHNHLSHCPACAAEVAAWERITNLAAQGALAEPPHYPLFDLSFLSRPAQIWTHLRAGVQRLSYEIPAALVLLGKRLLSPPPGLAVSYATVQASRRDAQQRDPDNLVSFSVDDRPQDVHIALNVTAAEKAFWLAVSLHMLSSGQVLTGARIALCDAQGKAQEIKTVRRGESEARFPNIAPGRYLVRIERSGMVWELPISL